MLDYGTPVYRGPFGLRQAERLLWRAGFGPAPGQATALAGSGLNDAVLSLTRPSGPEVLTGPEPRADKGGPLFPVDALGHDHLWWLDRMVRTNRPLMERMTLIWHDWFATSDATVRDQRLMLTQNDLFRHHALGSFRELLLDVTVDTAMLVWLNGNRNTKGDPDENYARELMELFSLGADRGAYTEQDVRELARALTGWTATRSGSVWSVAFNPSRHDGHEKTVFGQTGRFDWRDACRLCWEHPLHPSFVVAKLWSYFIPTPPDEGTASALEQLYVSHGHEIRPLVEAILLHPDLYLGPPLVKPPVVFVAGLLRARGKRVQGQWLLTYGELAGQLLFRPPNVAGWNHDAWLDTTTMRARWHLVWNAIDDAHINSNGPEALLYDASETAVQAVDRAVEFMSNPPLSVSTRGALERWAADCMPLLLAQDSARRARAGRQNALRQLIGSSPDYQVC